MARNDQVIRQWTLLTRLNQRPTWRSELAEELGVDRKTIAMKDRPQKIASRPHKGDRHQKIA